MLIMYAKMINNNDLLWWLMEYIFVTAIYSVNECEKVDMPYIILLLVLLIHT